MERQSNLLIKKKEQDSGEMGSNSSAFPIGHWKNDLPPFSLYFLSGVTGWLGKTVRSWNDGPYLRSKVLLFQQLQMSPTLDASHTESHTHIASFHKWDFKRDHHRPRTLIKSTEDNDTFFWVKTCRVWPCLWTQWAGLRVLISAVCSHICQCELLV